MEDFRQSEKTFSPTDINYWDTGAFSAPILQMQHLVLPQFIRTQSYGALNSDESRKVQQCIHDKRSKKPPFYAPLKADLVNALYSV